MGYSDRILPGQNISEVGFPGRLNQANSRHNRGQGWKIQNDKYRIGGWIFQMRQIQSDSFIWTNLDAIQILPWTNSDGTFSYGQI